MQGMTLGNLKLFQKTGNFITNSNTYHHMGRPLKKVDTLAYLQTHEELYRRILKKSKAQLVVDSTKNRDRVQLLAKSKHLKPTIIHLVRDGRAVTWSYMKKYKKGLPSMLRWVTSNIRVEIVRRRTKLKYIFVRYEDLATQPEQTIKHIVNSLGFDFEPGMLNFRKGEHHQAGGNRMRFSKTSEIRPDTAWRTAMPLYARFAFNLLFGWLNLYYKVKKSL